MSVRRSAPSPAISPPSPLPATTGGSSASSPATTPDGISGTVVASISPWRRPPRQSWWRSWFSTPTWPANASGASSGGSPRSGPAGNATPSDGSAWTAGAMARTRRPRSARAAVTDADDGPASNVSVIEPGAPGRGTITCWAGTSGERTLQVAVLGGEGLGGQERAHPRACGARLVRRGHLDRPLLTMRCVPARQVGGANVPTSTVRPRSIRRYRSQSPLKSL